LKQKRLHNNLFKRPTNSALNYQLEKKFSKALPVVEN